MRKAIYQVGQKIGNCFFVKDEPNRLTPKGQAQRFVTFKCECGNEFTTRLSSVLSGDTTTCGCKLKLINGQVVNETPEYRAWQKIKDRCCNPRAINYKDYGGRGITVSDSWKESFLNFYADMGKRPSDKYSIDRIDNEGGYSKENCRWATQKQQNRNTRRALKINFFGSTLPLADVADMFGVELNAFRSRIKSNWSLEKAITQPIKHRACV